MTGRTGPENVALDALPGRLREKLGHAAPTARGTRLLSARVLIAALLLVVVLTGALLTQRYTAADRSATTDAPTGQTATTVPTGAPSADPSSGGPQDAAAEPLAPPLDLRAGTPGAGGRAAPAPAPGTSPTPTGQPGAGAEATALGEPGRATPAPAPAREPGPVASAPAATFALAVGTYLNEDRAIAERVRLNQSTNHATRIATVADNGGVPMYRVTMGSFPTRTDAERAASELISRGLVDEARVIAVRATAR